MNTLVVYDSKYGNTEKIARAMGKAIGTEAVRADTVSPADLGAVDLLVIGSPTHGGWYTEAVKALLDSAPSLDGLSAAVFDTRTVKWSWIFGRAAKRLARRLETAGAKILTEPEGFFVLGMEGPLKDGEIDRAGAWAQTLPPLD